MCVSSLLLLKNSSVLLLREYGLSLQHKNSFHDILIKKKKKKNQSHKTNQSSTSIMSVAGIDFGSKSNVVALARRKGIDVVMNEESKRETPSLINFGDKCVGVSRLIFLIFQSRRFSREERKNRSSPSQHATHTHTPSGERERERKRE